jgi:hypothetical protein
VAMSKTPTEVSVNGALLEAFRHNSWAARQLLAFCRDLSEEQLAASATGTYGSIRATFNHLVFSDGRYLLRLAGGAPPWVDRPDDADLDELAARAERRGSCGSDSCPSRSMRNAWSSSTMGPWRFEPASSSRRRSITETRTGSRSAPS